jgi:hypothetical protein
LDAFDQRETTVGSRDRLKLCARATPVGGRGAGERGLLKRIKGPSCIATVPLLQTARFDAGSRALSGRSTHNIVTRGATFHSTYSKLRRKHYLDYFLLARQGGSHGEVHPKG